MSFGALNIVVTLQISNKILFEEPFGDALIKCVSNKHSYKETLAAINHLTSKFQELFGGQRTCPQSSVYVPKKNPGY